jgi:S-adenosylmethionine/arginine decarboxylase-like enzyme
MIPPKKHYHLLINGYTKALPPSKEYVINWLLELSQEMGLEVIEGPLVSYINKEEHKSISSVLIMKDSHLGIHLWEDKINSLFYIQFDFYTVGDFSSMNILRSIDINIGIVEGNWTLVDRDYNRSFKMQELKDYP